MCSLSSSARAQPAPAPPPAGPVDAKVAEAAELFKAGREATKKGEFQRAAELFRRSQELQPGVGTLLNLAAAEEQLGRVATALEHYETALTQLAADDDRVPIGKEGVAKVKPRVPSLKIERAAGAPPSTRIELEGAPLAASSVGAARPMNPGTYALKVTAPGHEARRYDVKLGEGQHVALAVEPGNEIPPPPPPKPPPPSVMPKVGLAVGGVGVAGLGIGAVTGILAIVKRRQLDTTCPDPSKCSADGLKLEASGKTLAAMSTASLVIGALGVGAGLTLVLVGREPSTPTPAAALRIAPLPGGGFVGVNGAF